MDAIDRRILLALQENADISIAQLADKAGLSQTPCWKRVQKLEEAGVIMRRVAILAPEKLGLGLTVFVQVSMEALRATPEIARVVIGSTIVSALEALDVEGPISAFEIVAGYVGAAATKSTVLGLIIIALVLAFPLGIAGTAQRVWLPGREA